jgi:methylmalonyl-CoA mutase C-terminal domain/subunit
MIGNRRIRVLIAKPGLDGHDRGAKVVARALRDAGMEVVYTGIHQTPEMVAETAAQEDVDVIGLSILSGAHVELVKQTMEELRERHMEHVVVLVGGIIPQAHHDVLKSMGVASIFGPGTATGDIARTIKEALRKT